MPDQVPVTLHDHAFESLAATLKNEEEVQLAIRNAMYIRDRLTILEINHILNLSGELPCQPPL